MSPLSIGGHAECSPGERRGAEIAAAENGVAPTAVGIGVRSQPTETSKDQGIELFRRDRLLAFRQSKSYDGCRGRQGAGRQLAFPNALARAQTEEGCVRLSQSRFEPQLHCLSSRRIMTAYGLFHQHP